MNCIVIIFAFLINIIRAEDVKQDILDYFNSDAVITMKEEWMPHRPALENAIGNALQEVIGKNGLNVISLKPTDLKLAKGFAHQHGHVHIVFIDLELVELPQCWLPEVSFSLPSNLIKIESKLTKMILVADYYIVRNKSDIVSDYDPYKHSPFLFNTVPNKGKVALTLDGCILSGYVITRLSGNSINLGHHKFSLTRCDYNIEIYNSEPGGPPPVLSHYSAKKPPNSLGFSQIVLKPLRGELISKIQGALFSYVNTSAIFGNMLPALEEEQSHIFLKTANYLNTIVRGVNEKTAKTNEGAIDINDFFIAWDDFKPRNITEVKFDGEGRGGLRLTNMVMTGLDTIYLSNSGGPYKLATAMIGEQIRFSTLQIRGQVCYTQQMKDIYKFAIEIRDFAVDIDIDVEAKKPTKVEMVGFRDMEFSQPRLVFRPSEAVITARVLNEIPKLISRIIRLNLSHGKQVSPASGEDSGESGSDEGNANKRSYFVSHVGVKNRNAGKGQKRGEKEKIP